VEHVKGPGAEYAAEYVYCREYSQETETLFLIMAQTGQ